MTRALVTGGAGFVGSHLTEALSCAGYDVLVIDNLATGTTSNLPADVRFEQIDITDARRLQRAFAQFRPQLVFHQAAQTLIAASSADPLLDAATNILGTLHVLQATIAARARKFVFASSGGTVYGNPTRHPVPEDEPLRPVSPYGVSKVAGEYYVRSLCEQHEVPYTILRYGNVYGPRDNLANQHVITAFLYALLRGSRPAIEWDGEQSKDYVYVGDVVAANLCATTRGDNESFNIGSGSAITVNEIFKQVCALTRADVIPMQGQKRPGDVRHFVLDCRKAKRQLGWYAQTSFAQGLHRTAEYYRRGVLVHAGPAG